MTDGRQTLRRVTDEKGRFWFEELQPGRWTLKVDKERLPEYHYCEREQFDFELSPGGGETLDIRVLPRKRTVRIIQEGGTLKD